VNKKLSNKMHFVLFFLLPSLCFGYHRFHHTHVNKKHETFYYVINRLVSNSTMSNSTIQVENVLKNICDNFNCGHKPDIKKLSQEELLKWNICHSVHCDESFDNKISKDYSYILLIVMVFIYAGIYVEYGELNGYRSNFQLDVKRAMMESEERFDRIRREEEIRRIGLSPKKI